MPTYSYRLKVVLDHVLFPPGIPKYLAPKVDHVLYHLLLGSTMWRRNITVDRSERLPEFRLC